MNKEKMQNMLRKSRHQFLAEKIQESHEVMQRLLYFVAKGESRDYEGVHRFFHSVKGSAGTLELEEISDSAEKIQVLLEEKEAEGALNDHEVGIVVKGLGEILVLMEGRLKEEFNEEPKEKSRESVVLNSGELSSRAGMKKSLNQEDLTSLQPIGRILLIDDEVAVLSLIGSILRNYNYEVMLSPDPEEAMDTLKTEAFDLVIVDVMMPGKSGFDIHEYIIREKLNIPVVFLTGVKNKEVRYEALRQGVDHFLEKPIEPAELLSRVEGIMKKQHKKNTEVFTDELTGAFNRKYFTKRFEEERQRHQRQGKEFSIAFMDLDRFKEINDTYGHLFGDEVLKEFVKGINQVLREYDQVFRYGGDEFIILLPETTEEDAYMVVERIRKSLKEKVFTPKEETEYRVSFSCGIAMMKDQVLSMTQLLEKADAALYRAKEKGRDQTIYALEKKAKTPRKILIVDDARLIANLIKTRLSYLNYEIAHALDGEEALGMVEDFKPDLILLDIMLPKITGTEVLKKLKGDPKYKELKIIMISAKNKERDILNNIRLGADEFITKPFSLELLEEKIKKLI